MNWGTGPLFYFDGNSINPLPANGTAAVPPPANVTGPFKGDFDGDGDADIVRRTASNGRVVVSINAFASLEPATWNASGAGNYIDFVSGSATSSILVGDFNGDGRDDLIQPDMDTGVWSVMRANPAGVFDRIEIPVSGLINPDLPTFSWNSQSNVLSWKPRRATPCLPMRFRKAWRRVPTGLRAHSITAARYSVRWLLQRYCTGASCRS